MATRKLSSELRRLSRSYHSLRPLQSCVLLNPKFPPSPGRPSFLTTSNFDPNRQLRALLPFATSIRHFSSDPSESEFSSSNQSLNPGTELELDDILFPDGYVIPDPQIGGVVADSDYILPIKAVVSLLDWIHDTTGLPWWITIVSSTLMLRVSLFPFLLFQLHKLKKIGQCLPKLPPPFPPPFSGKSYVKHLSNFRRERKAIGCPSLLWFLANFSVQAPCFILWMTSMRRMSLDHHTGFDTGGVLWFHNLTELAHGAPGLIFPTLIAGLHLLNVQTSFKSSRVEKETGTFALLGKYYKYYLRALTVPIFITGFYVPHGSLVYWTTNSSLSIMQHLCLQNPTIREKLGLPREQAIGSAKDPPGSPGPRKVPVKDLSPKELVGLSVLSLSRGNKDGALPFLRLALDKDPEYVRALTIMGQTLLQNGQEAEAIKCFERAIAKLSRPGLPTEVEDVDLLIQASQWAGVAYIRQGKLIEGRVHLERVASIEEPEDLKSKVHYYDGIVFLASALISEGRKAEAITYLQKAVAYNPDFSDYLEQCKKDSDDFVDDLASSRRGNR